MESNSQTTWDIQFGNSGFNTWDDAPDSTNRIDLYRFIQFVEFNNEFQPEVAIEYLRGCLSTSYDEHARYIIGWAYLDMGQIDMAKSVFIEGFTIHKSLNSLIPLINIHIQLYELNYALMYLGKNQLYFDQPFLRSYFYIIDNLKLYNNALALDKVPFEHFLEIFPDSKEDITYLIELNHIVIVNL